MIDKKNRRKRSIGIDKNIQPLPRKTKRIYELN